MRTKKVNPAKILVLVYIGGISGTAADCFCQAASFSFVMFGSVSDAHVKLADLWHATYLWMIPLWRRTKRVEGNVVIVFEKRSNNKRLFFPVQREIGNDATSPPVLFHDL